MSKNKSLLEKEGPISLEELKIHFQKNDPITVYSENPEFSSFDFKTVSDDEKSKYHNIETIFSETWDQQMQAYSGRIFMKDYSMDYPVLSIKQKTEQIVATTVMRILRDKGVYNNVMRVGYDILKEPFEIEVNKYCKEKGKLPFMLSNEERAMIFDQLADQFLDRMVSLLQDALNLPEIFKICKAHDAFEDYNCGTGNKTRSKFQQKWYHTRVKSVETMSLDDLYECEKEDTISAKATQNSKEAKLLLAFCENLNEVDKQIVLLSYDGRTQKEIAEIIGFASQASIAKRKKKLLAQFKNYISED